MDERHDSAFRGQIPIFLTEPVLCAVMVAVYACIGRLNGAVLLGAGCGAAAALLNHCAMIFAILKAEKSENIAKAQLRIRLNYWLRTAILFGALVVVIKFGGADPLATLLPLILMRVSLFIGGLLMKGGRKN